MNKTVSSVIDDINEWQGPNGTIYYVTAFFTDESVGSAGRKDMDAALELQGLLQEAIGQELDFVLEPKKPTKSGKEAWKILGFGTPGGAATYTAPGVPVTHGGHGLTINDQGEFRRSKEEMRRTDALQAAASFLGGIGVSPDKVCELADYFGEWLAKTSDASSAYPSTDSPSVTPAGASEDSSGVGAADGASSGRMSADPRPTPEDRGGGVESEGKEPAPPPHDFETHDGTLIHIHDWQPHPNLRNKLKCECGEMRNKESVR